MNIQGSDMQTIISEAIFTYLRIYVLLVALEWAFGDDSDAITEIPKKALYIHV